MDQCLKNLSTCYQGCEEEISELVYQINKMLNEKKLEWESSYNKLLLSHTELTENLNVCKVQIEDKDTEIIDLRKEITVIDQSNYEKRMALESKIYELSQTVSDLKSHLKSNAKFNSSSNDSDSLELAISALKKECDYHQDKIAELEVVQTTHVAQIKLLEEQRSNILKKNEELKQKFAKCRKVYHSKLNATDCELDSFARQKEDYEASINKLEVMIVEKDRELKDIKDTLEDVLSSNHKNNSLFSNMEKNFDAVSKEKDSLMKRLDDVLGENQKLQRDNEKLTTELDIMEKNAENTSYGAQSEVSMLKAQLEIYVKENDFLRTLLLQHDHSGTTPNKHLRYLEKLEEDNNSLKENIVSMEGEIANLIRISEQGYKRGEMIISPSVQKSEVKQVKERYDRHLRSMKAEVEQLTLENLSLKAMHQQCEHSIVISEVGSNCDSVILKKEEERHREINNTNAVLNLRLPVTPSNRPNHIDSPGVGSEKSLLLTNSPLTKEFKELQENVLKEFEAKLNKCVLDFNTDADIAE